MRIRLVAVLAITAALAGSAPVVTTAVANMASGSSADSASHTSVQAGRKY